MDTCVDCVHWQIKIDNLNNGDCTRFPPTVLIVPQQGLRIGEVQMGMMVAYPTVPRNFAACGEIEFKEESDNEPATAT